MPKWTLPTKKSKDNGPNKHTNEKGTKGPKNSQNDKSNKSVKLNNSSHRPPSKKDAKLSAMKKWKNFLDSNVTPKVCGICLEAYQTGDQVCLSYNEDCEHVFHKDCIMSWLVNHEDCPNCRASFLKPIDL